MENSGLWLVGAVALVVVVAAFVWVLRHRDDASAPEHHGYEAPEVTGTGGRGRGDLTFGSDGSAVEAPIDQTVPLSRLGGAGWRDGGDVPEAPTTDAYAGQSPSWAEEPSADASGSPFAQHIAVDTTHPSPAVDEDLDHRRGGHW